MGRGTTAGMGQIPARQAAIKAGLPTSVPALTVNKVCASSLKAVNLAALLIRNGDAKAVVAGGMESMSQAPYLLEKARFGYRLGDGALVDSMVRDGLIDPANGCHMAVEGSNVAKEFEVSRERQDEYAYASQQRYATALKAGSFKEELIPIAVANPKGTTTVAGDEQPRPETTIEGLARLKPVFTEDGTITAGEAPGAYQRGRPALPIRGREASGRDLPALAALVASRAGGGQGEQCPSELRDPALSPEQQEIRKLARQFAEREVKPRAEAIDHSGEFPRDLVAKAAKLGVLGILVPDDYDGAGLDHVSF